MTPPDVLRRAIHLALATEGEGIARASRLAQLCLRVLDRAPNDGWATLALARAHLVLGETAAARMRLAAIEATAPQSSAAAEAQVVRIGLDEPHLEPSVQRLLRAALTGPESALGDVAARLRQLGMLNAHWPAWVAAGMAERRRSHHAAARSALEAALTLAPGATTAHLELAEVLMASGDANKAVQHAARALALEGEAPRALRVLARAHEAAGSLEEARAAAKRATAIDPEDGEARAIVDRLRRPSEPPGLTDRMRAAWRAWTR
jgi:predicted Zn-dependent protease